MIDSSIKEIITSAKLSKYQKLSAILKYLFVDIAGISQNKYYILGSYAIREYRKISDLDINLDSVEFYKLKTLLDKKFGVLQIYNNQIRWFFDMTTEYNKLNGEFQMETDFSIEAFQKLEIDGFPNADYSLKSLQENKGLSIDDNGHQFFNLSTLLKWKQTMNRTKDQADIELITKLLFPKTGGRKNRKTKQSKITKTAKK